MRCPTLVLARHVGEKIYISPDIVLTVVDIDKGKVRIGVEAPRDVGIYRDDVKGLDTETVVEIVKASQQSRRKK